ncbi:MAG: leucine-rich repeat domain-containing protein [Oscillospiraceae bacterium]|nr:leucine-rich repeat domain-containing protein [Oscillospiraceae bacterium]
MILPDGMEVIKDHAFFKYKMKKAVIPASVRMIEKGAFSFCE